MHELKNYTVQIFKNFLKMVEFRATYSNPIITSLLFCLNLFWLGGNTQMLIFALEISMNKYTFFVIFQLIDNPFLLVIGLFLGIVQYICIIISKQKKNHTSSQFPSQTCFDAFVLDYSRKFLAISWKLKKQKKI